MASNPRFFNPDDPLELAAARMTRFLARQPRSRKTRAYLQSLPKRGKPVVMPSDYPPLREPESSWREKMLREIRDAQRYADWEARGKPPSPSVPPKKRKDRLRPRGRDPLRERLYAAQAGMCGICGGDIHGPREATIDHVLPRGLGGKNAGNVLLAHYACNHAKADRPPTGRELQTLALVNGRLASMACSSTVEPSAHNGFDVSSIPTGPTSDSDGTATAAANEDLPVPQDCQARAVRHRITTVANTVGISHAPK